MKKIHFFYLLIVAIVVSISVSQLNFDNPYSRSINSDGKGYYAYLPAMFIYNDFTFSFVDEAEAKYYPQDGSHAKLFLEKQPNGTAVNKYFPGVALFYLPFFAFASLLSAIFGLPVDGYSILFQWGVSVAHWFYLFGAFLLLGDAFNNLKFKPRAIITGLIAITFATNLMYYVVYDFTVTHLFGFFGCSALIWCLVNYQLSRSFRYVGIFMGVLAILLIVRPTNLMMLFIVPLLLEWNSILKLVNPKTWFVKYRWIYLAIASFILFSAPLLWKIQTGNWLVYSYGEEGFNFLQPHLFDFLFSYEKGWLLWSPVISVMLILAGLYFYRTQKIRGYIFFISILGITYIFSCWWIWTFGLAFGQRPMIDFYPIILLGFIGFLNTLKTKAYFLLALPFVAVNCIQTYQFHEGILFRNTSNGKAYWSHFLKLKKDPPRVIVSNEWKKSSSNSDHSEAILNKNNPFSKAIEIGILPKNTKVVINCLLSGENKKTETQLVLSDSTGSFYQVHYLMGDVYNAERELQYSFEINQKITTPLRCYFWNPNETYPVLLKQFEIFVYQKK